MGQGIDLAKLDSPEMATMLENMRDQLLIVLLRRLGGDVRIPAEEMNDTGQLLMMMAIRDNSFHFQLKGKN